MRRRLLLVSSGGEEPTIENYEIVIERFVYDTVTHDTTEITPVISYYYIPIYSDGTEGDKIYNTSELNEASVSFSIVTDYPDTVFVDENGVIHCDVWEDYLLNIGQYRLVGTVTMTVSLKRPNATSQTIDAKATAEATQSSVDVEWNDPVVTLTYDPNPAPAQPDEEGGTIELKPTVKWTLTGKYSDGTTAPEHNETNDSSAFYTFTSENGILKPDQNSGVITVDPSEIESEHDLDTIQVKVEVQSKTGYGTCLIRQKEYYPPVEVQNLMDVVFYNKENGKLCIMNRLQEDYTDYPSSTYTPIGIVVAECDNDTETYGQNGYNAGKPDGFNPQTIGIMALNNTSSGSIMWGGVNAINWILENDVNAVVNRVYSIPLCNTGNSRYNGEWADDDLEVINPSVVAVPSDKFAEVSSADEDAFYKDGYNLHTLSPYIKGLFNYNVEYWENFYEDRSGDYYYNCFSDFSGEEKSQTYLHRMTDAVDYIDDLDINWMDKESVSNSPYMLPAMEACYKYSTDGTGESTWYLPSAGEFGHVLARMNAIDTVLTELASVYGVSVTKLSDTTDVPYLTSTLGFFSDANSHAVGCTGDSGMSLQWNIGNGDVIGAGYTRPFKRMDVYYKDSEGYFHDGDMTEKEWYDQIPTAYKDDYAQHIGIYRNTNTSSSSGYPSDPIMQETLYGVLVNGEDDFTIIRTDVPLFTIESLASGENIVVKFDQNPQCGWYVPQYIGINEATGVMFFNVNSNTLKNEGRVDTGGYWAGKITIKNRYKGDINSLSGSDADSETGTLAAFKAGDWNYNIALYLHKQTTGD